MAEVVGTPQVDGEALDRSAPDEPDALALAAEFPAARRSDWVALVDQVLRRAGRLTDDAEPGSGPAVLTRTTLDGLAVPPLYTSADVADLPPAGVPGRRPFVRGGRPGGAVPNGWDVRQRHADPDAAAAREAILSDLANGATSVWLAVGGGGTAVADLPAVLDGVLLHLAAVVLDTAGAPGGEDAVAAAEAFLALVAGRGVDTGEVRGNLGLDPVGRRARTAAGPPLESVVPLALRLTREFPQLKAVIIDSLPVHVAGGSDAQELGYALSAGAAYLRVLTGAGLDVDTAARLLEFRLAATAEQFATIAKQRAARRLWARVLQLSGAAPGTAQTQHAVASPTMYARRDPYTNLLRGTLAAFAAGVGGADAVTVAPFDAALGSSTAFSRRIARNTQSLLVMEAHLARVIDPAGGSWFVESLTDGLARAGWAVFQELEAAGGVVGALDTGVLAARIAEVRGRRDRGLATRRTPVTGVSEFADLEESPVERAGPDLLTTLGFGGSGLPVHRPAGAFEALRDRSDAIRAATGARPRVFLATLGPLAASTARAAFARNLFHAGGVDTAEAGPTSGVEEVLAAFRAADTPVAVLCSSDAVYADRAAETVTALRAAGARHVLLAGRAEVDALDGWLFSGCDALAVLDTVHAVLGSRPATRTPEAAR